MSERGGTSRGEKEVEGEASGGHAISN